MLSKFQVVCAISEIERERPHFFFTWATDVEEAVFACCPKCGSEGISATPCKPNGQGIGWKYQKEVKP